LVTLPFVLLLSATHTAISADKGDPDLYEAAKRDGQVTYSPQEAVLSGLEKEFPKTFPAIEIKWAFTELTELATKLITEEKRGGGIRADLALGSIWNMSPPDHLTENTPGPMITSLGVRFSSNAHW
jgi:hypothetical protein